MNKRYFFLILIAVLSLLFIIAASVSAQDIDVNNMDNAELMALLQAILQKLETDDPQVITAEEPVPAAVPGTPAEPDTDPVSFEIYENKKLTVEALPAYMFIQKPTGGSKDDASEPYDRLRDLSRKAYDNDYLGVRSMGGFSSPDELYDFWQENAKGNDWDEYEKQMNDYINSK